MVETEGPQMTSQYGAYALRAGLERLYARMGMHTPTRPGTYMHARKRKHAHTDQNEYLLLFHGNSNSRTRLSVTIHVHCLSCWVFSREKKSSELHACFRQQVKICLIFCMFAQFGYNSVQDWVKTRRMKAVIYIESVNTHLFSILSETECRRCAKFWVLWKSRRREP
jgi:hypothetical protein